VARVIVTPSADAAEIVGYLHVKAGYGVAAKYNASFEQIYDHLADFPDSEAPRPKMGLQIRIGIVSRMS
jgi:plasmid stabilization system protein ParE